MEKAEENNIFDLQYYEKLGFNNFDLWSDKDVADFLILDYLNTYKKIKWAKDINESSFIEGQKRHIENYNRYRILLDFLDKNFLKLYSRLKKDGKKKILFEESKYFHIISEAKKHYQTRLIAQGKKDRLFAILNLTGYIQTNDLEQLVIFYLENKDIKYLRRLVFKIEERLMIVKPDYIVLTYDVFPIERAIVMIGRKLGIPVLVIQHAIHNMPNPVLDFKTAEYVLVWGNYFKEICLTKNMRKPENVYVLGYPHTIEKKGGSLANKSALVVCYLGQDLQRHNKELLKVKLGTINYLSEICKKLNIKFIYRHHYAEDRGFLMKKLPNIRFTPEKEKLENTLDKADIFISFSSTSLVEAAIRSKISLQLMNYPAYVDNFEKLGACNKSFKTVEEVAQYLEKIAKAPDAEEFKVGFNNDYIETRYDASRRFLEVIGKISKK
ncbi:MAG: hypothetical protein NT155_01240 [Candidatus Staskawiczbacteria bacterium]|nr:hypothetical protein [Candidatus Staskawiczbacteria bacterium]